MVLVEPHATDVSASVVLNALLLTASVSLAFRVANNSTAGSVLLSLLEAVVMTVVRVTTAIWN